jgi:hypothetical protein
MGAAVLALIAGVAAWWLVGRGVVTNDFPPFLDSQSVTPITRYSGPWLTAAAVAALLAALLALAAVFDLVRWSRSRTVTSASVRTSGLDSGGLDSGGPNSGGVDSGGLGSTALSSAQ